MQLNAEWAAGLEMGPEFHPREFRCRCGCGLGLESMDPGLLRRLLAARRATGLPMVITSAVRCPARNRAVGGSPASSHLGGHAVDIACVSSAQRLEMVRALMAAGIRRIGLGKGFIHADSDPAKPGGLLWLYN